MQQLHTKVCEIEMYHGTRLLHRNLVLYFSTSFSLIFFTPIASTLALPGFTLLYFLLHTESRGAITVTFLATVWTDVPASMRPFLLNEERSLCRVHSHPIANAKDASLSGSPFSSWRHWTLDHFNVCITPFLWLPTGTLSPGFLPLRLEVLLESLFPRHPSEHM